MSPLPQHDHHSPSAATLPRVNHLPLRRTMCLPFTIGRTIRSLTTNLTTVLSDILMRSPSGLADIAPADKIRHKTVSTRLLKLQGLSNQNI
ncbi:MAG: hypothetical protein ABGZ53_16595 [Fuerstiella sp.]